MGDDGGDSNEVEGSSPTNNDTNSSSSGDSIPAAANNTVQMPPSFPVTSIGNFPIIKIQQQGLPHLPPFVSSQNGQTPHYPLVTKHSFNVKFPPPPNPKGPCQYWV